MQRHILIAVIVAALFIAPAASANHSPNSKRGWFAYGTYEPDTIFDVQGGFMHLNESHSATAKKLYFNVYQTEFGAGTSINTGAAGSRYQMAGAQNFNAILGPWLDCNLDEYVGHTESALVVYPVALLPAVNICTGTAHIQGMWVWEYIPVGHDPREVPQDPQNVLIEDREALVWGDAGAPGAQQTGTCPISPFPHGTTAGTGWMLRYVDCFASRRITNATNTADPNDALGLKFDDKENPQDSDSHLNQHLPESLFGNPETNETGTLQLDSDEDGGDLNNDGKQDHRDREYAFTTWDCTGRLIEVKDPTGTALPRNVAVPDANQPGSLDGNEDLTDSNGNYVWIARPAPAVNNPRHSFADGLNETFMGIHAGSGDFDNDASATGGDCNYQSASASGDNSFGGDGTEGGLHQTVFFRADAAFEQGAIAAKKDSDEMFIFSNGGRNPPEVEGALGPGAPTSIVSTPMTDTAVSIAASGTGGWFANTIWATVPQTVNRNTLTASAPAYWSFYARVGAVTTGAPNSYVVPGGTGKYGSEACGSFTSGEHNGWDCDPKHWYTDNNFQPVVDGNEMWAGRVGFSYQFRDVDCFDGTVARGSGVRASLTDVSPGVDEDNDPNTPKTFACKDAP